MNRPPSQLSHRTHPPSRAPSSSSTSLPRQPSVKVRQPQPTSNPSRNPTANTPVPAESEVRSTGEIGMIKPLLVVRQRPLLPSELRQGIKKVAWEVCQDGKGIQPSGGTGKDSFTFSESFILYPLKLARLMERVHDTDEPCDWRWRWIGQCYGPESDTNDIYMKLMKDAVIGRDRACPL